MAGVLERAQLGQDDAVAEVDVGAGRVDAELDPQRAPLAQAARRAGPRAARRPRRDRVAASLSGAAAGRHGANARLTGRLKRGSPPLFRRDPRHSGWVVGRPSRQPYRHTAASRASARDAAAPSARLRHGLRTRTRFRERRRADAAGVAASRSAEERRAEKEARQRASASRPRRRSTSASRRSAASPSALAPAAIAAAPSGAAGLREQRPPEDAQAALRARHPRPLGARVRLLDLRDHDGRRPGPAVAGEPRAVQAQAENSVVYDAYGNKLATLTNNQGRVLLESEEIAPVMKEAVVAIEDRASTSTTGSTSRASPAPSGRTSASAIRGAGRVDDHPAVRQERARRPGQPNRVPEAARVGARLPPRAPVVEGQDPDRVPERDLLRRGRDRDRGRGEDLLRLQPPGLRRGRRCAAPAPRSCCPGRRPCSPG